MCRNEIAKLFVLQVCPVTYLRVEYFFHFVFLLPLLLFLPLLSSLFLPPPLLPFVLKIVAIETKRSARKSTNRTNNKRGRTVKTKVGVAAGVKSRITKRVETNTASHLLFWSKTLQIQCMNVEEFVFEETTGSLEIKNYTLPPLYDDDDDEKGEEEVIIKREAEADEKIEADDQREEAAAEGEETESTDKREKKKRKTQYEYYHAKTGRKKDNRKAAVEDLSLHDRKSAWVDAYGEARQAKCFVCRYNEVGFENVGFDMAHVVARCAGGTNTESWNRVPTCATCNRNTTSDTNLLDFIAEHYPKRLVAVAKYLFERFRQREPYLAQKYFADCGLEVFVRTLFGSCGIEIDNEKSLLAKFLGRHRTFSVKGAVQNDMVYRILRFYDECLVVEKTKRKEIDNIEAELVSLRAVCDRLVLLQKIEQKELEKAQNAIQVMTVGCKEEEECH